LTSLPAGAVWWARGARHLCASRMRRSECGKIPNCPFGAKWDVFYGLFVPQKLKINGLGYKNRKNVSQNPKSTFLGC